MELLTAAKNFLLLRNLTEAAELVYHPADWTYDFFLAIIQAYEHQLGKHVVFLPE
ncbi:MAG TPA: hypothetical protein VIJ25_10950 [Methylococcales bacterium]|jgi:hypothetical protein